MFVAYYRRPQILTGDGHSLTKRGYDTGPEVGLMKILKSENSNSGASSLLEVLEAQRANNDIYLAHYAALREQAKSSIVLEQSAGIWDIDF